MQYLHVGIKHMSIRKNPKKKKQEKNEEQKNLRGTKIKRIKYFLEEEKKKSCINQQKKGQVSKENEEPDTKKCNPSNGQNALMGSCSLGPVHYTLCLKLVLYLDHAHRCSVCHSG
jgi:hypothetical protein